MALVFYLSHPQVVVDAATPVPLWGLSEAGVRRCFATRDSPALSRVRAVVTSAERKAVETAVIFAEALGLIPTIHPATAENDRSATGFVPEPAFTALADRFFASPGTSVEGWERAADAQARIVAAVADALAATDPAADVLICGHGGVGTLLLCRHAGLPIARGHDQPGGGGNVVVYDRATMRPEGGWRPMEEVFHG